MSDAEDDVMGGEEEEVVDTAKGASSTLKKKGRGHQGGRDGDEGGGSRGNYESVDGGAASGEVKSVEGWIVFAANVHEEAQEDDILDKFGEHGEVKNIHVNLDRRTGFVKGYALVEYSEHDEAEAAIAAMNGADLLGQPLTVDWAFRKDSSSARRRRQ
ncbi:hypothetical protein M885DRAFT_506453 [Pelagophyceae sp. CCMP2097]|nr:hypothetical protein M885DRAFT_506453 [Pelagophyceae sp. CCMP2097]|mmetsp:Transcript_22449/g.75921  ORF Transcript_22449/g.75921 Transcript_22449/m.75921 type:complete len:158 (+) Transcript_22449:37-510(+)|eukprot:CAMPEP_0184101648 /NCGR_PEP_ID=MMETSP0974-20121125/12940_1 /TAXON_ID=483370 /ORGANISM="non described non described, Strain CCMP2097" /LENGTH=157 /DNA_ID=CAMNT_0026404581 /DNA_START=35 /DNA_END=508 /DNA_ORIENTATION=-